MTKHLPALLILLSCGAAMADGGLYKWVDDAGKVHYSDAPPLQHQKQGVAELNRQGVVRKQAESEQARQQREASEAVRKQEQQRQLDSARYDKSLLESYRNVDELRQDREKQLGILQASLDAQYSRMKTLNLQLRDMLKEQTVNQQQHRPVPAGLQHNIQVIQQEQKGLGTLIATKQAEYNNVRQKMQEDIARYQQISRSKQ
ncbi:MULTISPECIES: DUF4124 domain-containing protein [Aquitalea]|uniref:DUF4124 domain-containing protein n=1 Tax=Aquitalea TaxID=407217 RepID=UPI0007868F91|nr:MULTISPECIES: DUF4124 domain-containing protein [Aquitalea]QBJ77666.1 DUF4124 domain-containing protein [Aquitalea sp. USM4]